MRCEYNERKEVEHENSPKLTCMAEAIAARMTEVPIVPEITREGGLGSRDFVFIKKKRSFFLPSFPLSPLSAFIRILTYSKNQYEIIALYSSVADIQTD